MNQLRIVVLVVVCTLCAACESCPPVGAEAPPFRADTTEGGPVSLADYEGDVVLLDFFAIWCAPCIVAGPHIQALHDYYAGREDVHVLAVHVGDDYGQWESAEAYLEDKGYTYPMVSDGDAIADDYDVFALPTYVIIGNDGTVLHREHGGRRGQFDRMRQLIDAYLRSH